MAVRFGRAWRVGRFGRPRSVLRCRRGRRAPVLRGIRRRRLAHRPCVPRVRRNSTGSARTILERRAPPGDHPDWRSVRRRRPGAPGRGANGGRMERVEQGLDAGIERVGLTRGRDAEYLHKVENLPTLGDSLAFYTEKGDEDTYAIPLDELRRCRIAQRHWEPRRSRSTRTAASSTRRRKRCPTCSPWTSATTGSRCHRSRLPRRGSRARDLDRVGARASARCSRSRGRIPGARTQRQPDDHHGPRPR